MSNDTDRDLDPTDDGRFDGPPAPARAARRRHRSQQVAPEFSANQFSATQFPADQFPASHFSSSQFSSDPFPSRQVAPDQYAPDQYAPDQYAPDQHGRARHSDRHRRADAAGTTSRPVAAAGPRVAEPGSRRAARQRRSAPAAATNGTAELVAWVLTVVGVVVGLGLWTYSLHHWDLDAAGPRGIVSTIPMAFVACAIVLAGTAAAELSRSIVSSWRMTLVVGAMVLVMFGLPNLVDHDGSPPTAYLHVGFIGYIAAHGTLLHHVDARFSWPAFFTGGAYLQHLAGLPNVRSVLTWAPIVNELLYLAPMILLTRRFLASERACWVAIIVFYSGLWFEQDYFSPQAIAYLLLLTLLAVTFWVSPDRAGRGRFWAAPEQFGADISPRRSFLVELALVVLVAAMVIGHQLTPLLLIILLVILAVLRAVRYRMLWLITSLVFVAWFSYGARDFWSGHLDQILGGLGNIGNSVNTGLTTRVSGNPAYQQMQLVRVAWSAAFAVTALGGVAMLLWRRSANTLTLTAMAFSPFLLLGVQSYGGEVILRCFLYATPFLAILVGVLVEPVLAASRPLLRALLITPVVAALILGLVTVRGANVPFERVRPLELTAAEQLLQLAPHNASIGIVETFTPLEYVGVGSDKVILLSTKDPNCTSQLNACVLASDPDYVYLTKAQEARDQDRENLPSGWLLQTGTAQILAGGHYSVILRNKFAVVLKRLPQSTN